MDSGEHPLGRGLGWSVVGTQEGVAAFWWYAWSVCLERIHGRENVRLGLCLVLIH